MKIELHLLQSVPPANLNRDDTGAPKDADFGGHRRARLSSQSLKRAIRTSEVFRKIVSENVGIRTRRAAPYVAQVLEEEHDRDSRTARSMSSAAIIALLASGLDEKDQTSVLYYAAHGELKNLAQRLAEADLADEVQVLHAAQDELPDDDASITKDQKKAVADAEKALGRAVKPVIKDFIQAHKGRTSAADIALFGRMLAEEPQLNLDASCQVAHALSVDRVAPQFDYFTAVDDLKSTKEEDDAGAAMIGTTGFNAACYYRYAVVDLDQLATNLDGDYEAARAAVRAFLTAAVTALPSGKQNSFAAQVRPELVMAVVRHDGMPLSLVNAFAAPVQSNGQSIAYHATEALAEHWEHMETMYSDLLPDAQAPDIFVSTPHREALATVERAGLADAWHPTVRNVIDGVDSVVGAVHA